MSDKPDNDSKDSARPDRASPADAAPDSIGERIRLARKARNLNQADLAGRLGVTQPAVANWESGVHDPRRLVLARLADTLDVSLDWLAAGARSAVEADKHPAAAYLRRPLHHAPVITFQNAARFLDNPEEDPHSFAEDYIPVTTRSSRIFALFVLDDAMRLVFPQGALVVIDYADRSPNDGAFCLAMADDFPVIRRLRKEPDRLETYNGDKAPEVIPVDTQNAIIGCARVSIRIH